MTAAGAFGPADIVQSKEARPGLSFFVVTHRGDASGNSLNDDVIAVMRFNRVSEETSTVQFVLNRSDVVDGEGHVTAGVEWIGGELRIEEWPRA